MSDKHGSHFNSLYIFVALCVCTLLSILADWKPPNSKILLITMVLAVAVAKALFVLTYFMHLKFEGKWKFVLLAPTTILAIGLPLALLPDIGEHYYTEISPQAQEYANAKESGEDQHEEDGGGHH